MSTHPSTPDPDVSPCRSCGRSIRWVTTLDGKAMPLDPVPDHDHDGTIVPVYVDDATPGAPRVVRAQVLTHRQALLARASGRPVWRSHFATCPHADTHRRAADTEPTPDHTAQELPL